jgi:signal transduction histidine kinase/dipeptidyl aminopeptidase/acylaminoacyl peptidase
LNKPNVPESDAALRERRDAIRLGLARANTAAFVILMVVLGLAIAAMVQSWRADRETGRAGEASHNMEAMRRASQDKLWHSHLEQARSIRKSGAPGRRIKALEALGAAAAIRPSTELRNEFIAALSWNDLQESAAYLPFHTPTPNVAFDRMVQSCALAWNDAFVFDLISGQQAHHLADTDGSVGWLRFSPDGRFLSARHYDLEFAWWELASGREVGRVSAAHGFVPDSASDFSPDGRLLAVSGSHSDIRLLDAESGRFIKSFAGARHHRSLRFSPGGKKLAVAAGLQIELWDWERGTVLASVTNRSAANWITWHPGGRWLAFAGDDGTIGFWSWQDGRAWHWEGHRTPVQEVHLSPDSSRLVSWSLDNTTIEWDMATGQPLMKLEHTRAHAFSPDGRRLSFERPLKGVGFWEVTPSLECRAVIAPAAPFHAIELSADGAHLLAASEGELRLYDVKSGGERALANAPGVGQVRFTADGRSIRVSGPHMQTTWHLQREEALAGGETWRLVPEPSAPRLDEKAGAPMPPSPTSSLWLAAAETNGTIRLSKRDHRTFAELSPPRPAPLLQVCASRDGSAVAALTEAGHVLLWNIQAIRKQLAAVGMDFDQPLPAIHSTTAPPLGVTGSFNTRVLSFAVMSGVLLAAVLAVFVRQRQQRLLASYLSIDALVTQRNEQLAQAQAELLHGQKMRALGTLASGIAHDFNNLLSVIRMSNKLVAREVKDNPSVQENAAEIEQAVEQGKTVVRSMLGYSRETADDGRPYSVAELVENLVALLGKQFLSGITLTLELEPDLPPVRVPKGRLEQILLNLVVNAAEAMNGNGKLVLAARRMVPDKNPFVLAPHPAVEYVEVLVTDSGPGIAPEVLPRIFEPFFTTKNVGATRGTGLGLSMVHTIAQDDGLGIEVESAPGNGTAFKIIIPVTKGA